MLGKDKFLEKTKYLIFLVIIVFSHTLVADTTKSKILIYNQKLKNSSALFIQSDGESVEEGTIYFGNDRIKINYTKPKELTIILSEEKGVYINHELKESQYFNTKKSYIKIFFKILNGDNFPEKLKISENFIEINNKLNIDKNFYKIKIIYENEPIKLRKISILENNKKIDVGFFNHNNIKSFEKKFFSMVNPYLF